MPNHLAQYLRLLKPYLKEHRLALIFVGVSLLLQIALSGVLPVSYKHFLDQIQHHIFETGLLVTLVLLLVGIALCSIWADYMLSKIGAQVLTDLKVKLLDAINHLPFDFFRDPSTASNMVTIFNKDASVVGTVLQRHLPAFFLYASQILVCFTVMFFLSWVLALAILILFPCTILLSRLFVPASIKADSSLREADISVVNTVHEMITMHSVITAFQLQSVLTNKFKQKIIDSRPLNITFTFLSQLIERCSSFGSILLAFSIITVGAYAVLHGYTTISVLIGFFVLVQTVVNATAQLGIVFPRLLEGGRNADRILEFLQEASQTKKSTGSVPAPMFSDKLCFDKVSFNYQGQNQHLSINNISFTIQAGESVAFVGSSGSGKSTVLALLMHFYSPNKGEISIDGQDLNTISMTSFRKQTSIIMQDTSLFDMTIRENIRIGKPDASDAEIVEASKLAELDDMVSSLPLGYDTLIENGGKSFSGGQRQRIAIARALLRKPKILFCDEVTAALDPLSEVSINESLMQIAKHCTLLYVTHQLHTVVNMDRIFVMENGQLIESGTHEELLALKGQYYTFWNKQNRVSLTQDGQNAHVSLELLHSIPLFQTLDDALLKTIAQSLILESYDANTVLFNEGDLGDKFYIIVRGAVNVTRFGKTIAALEQGDYFGEIALVKNIPRTARIHTTLPCLLLTLNQQQFHHIFNQSAALRAEFEKIVAMREQ